VRAKRLYWAARRELLHPVRSFHQRFGSLARQARAYERQTLAVIRRTTRAESSCVDVGCYQGVVLRAMVAAAPQGRHWAFEPVPDRAAALQARFPGVTVVAAAASDTSGTTRFTHVLSNPETSGMRPRLDQPRDAVTEQLTVPVCRLDDVLPADQPVDLVTIDVVGAELLVMRGAYRTLSTWRPTVIFEQGGYHYGHEPREVYDLLTACCLEVTTMARWLGRRPPLGRDGFLAAARAGEYYFMAC